MTTSWFLAVLAVLVLLDLGSRAHLALRRAGDLADVLVDDVRGGDR
ncbi:hypothetical protein ACFHW2_12150 [Actinomadura sp. LOL_016]